MQLYKATLLAIVIIMVLLHTYSCMIDCRIAYFIFSSISLSKEKIKYEFLTYAAVRAKNFYTCTLQVVQVVQVAFNPI